MIQPLTLDVDFAARVTLTDATAVDEERAGQTAHAEAFTLPATDRRVATTVAYIRPFDGAASGSDLRFQVMTGDGQHVALAASYEIACHWVMAEAYRFAARDLDDIHKRDQRRADQLRLARHG